MAGKELGRIEFRVGTNPRNPDRALGAWNLDTNETKPPDSKPNKALKKSPGGQTLKP